MAEATETPTPATGQPPAPPRPPQRSWGRILLIGMLVLSLIGNALALGALKRLSDLRDDLIGPGADVARLPVALRSDLRDALRDERRRLAPFLREALQARRALVLAMTDSPHDRAATEAAMTRFRASLDRLLAEAQPVLLDRLDARSAPK